MRRRIVPNATLSELHCTALSRIRVCEGWRSRSHDDLSILEYPKERAFDLMLVNDVVLLDPIMAKAMFISRDQYLGAKMPRCVSPVQGHLGG